MLLGFQRGGLGETHNLFIGVGKLWIEAQAEATDDPETRAALRDQLETLEGQVARLTLPITFRRHLFALRRDIGYVRDQLAPGRGRFVPRPQDSADGVA